jgi:hypothetical protein
MTPREQTNRLLDCLIALWALLDQAAGRSSP